MQYLELMIGSMMFNGTSNFKTNILWLDMSIILIIFIGTTLSRDSKIFNSVKKKIHDFLYPNFEKKRLKFSFKRGEQSNRCKALFHYLSNRSCIDSKVDFVIEDIFNKYDYKSDQTIEKNNLYRVDQEEPFDFTEDIKGRVFTEEKETTEYNGKVTYKQLITLIVYSDTKSRKDLQDFVESCNSKYDKYLKEQMLSNQYLITVEDNSLNSSDEGYNKLKVDKEIWNSNVSFESRFFPEKQKVLKIINKFLNSTEWYKKKGIPHTLGILLSGEPGCGKTSFIKAMMNYTKRHCIDIKLNDDFDFKKLRKIIHYEQIDSEVVVPQDKRIIVFEDIDAMGNIVKDRGIKEKENIDAENKIRKEMAKLFNDSSVIGDTDKCESTTVKNKISKLDNNNLSYLLNILDGINETPGRIIIMTTNKPEILDDALVRPGRIDIHLNFGRSDEDDIKNILYHFWKNDDDKYNKISRRINSCEFDDINKRYTPAEIIDFCRKSDSLDESIKLLFEKV